MRFKGLLFTLYSFLIFIYVKQVIPLKESSNHVAMPDPEYHAIKNQIYIAKFEAWIEGESNFCYFPSLDVHLIKIEKLLKIQDIMKKNPRALTALSAADMDKAKYEMG